MTQGEYAVVLVYAASHAMRLEKLLRNEAIPCKLIPVPRHLSTDCGACVRINIQDIDAVRSLLGAAHLEVVGIQAI
jgi:hypothetical protein